MSKTVRERIALVIFFVLVLGGAMLAFSYFSTGRGWSVAATAVDDSVGQLDGYTAVVYSGVAPADPDQTSAEADLIRDQEQIDPESEEDLGLSLLSLASEVSAADAGRIFVSDVRDLYETRGASVLSLDVSDQASRYAVPQVFTVNGKKIGVFSITERLTPAQLEEIIDGLREEGAQSVICIAPRPALISSYDGLDVVLITQAPHEYSITNEPEDGTVIAHSPEKGSVGIILLSSNNVPSAKSVSSL